jgi:probable F420-dependent oxidoreductase
MRYSVTFFATDQTMRIDQVAIAAEDRGLDALWVGEHTHIPVSRQTPFSGGELPMHYGRWLDPFVALTAAATATSTLRLCTGILLVSQHDAIITAKAVASLDHLSGGRVTLGIGFGWNVEEMRGHGVDYASRRARVREHVLAMRRLWEDDVASFEGDYVSFEPSWAWPKPIQRPLPVLFGGNAGAKMFDHIAEYGQGWMPVGGRGLEVALPELRKRVADVGRDPDGLEIVPFACPPDHERIDSFEQLGVTECIFAIPPAGADEVLPALDRLQQFVSQRES